MAHPPTFDALPAELKILVFSHTTIKGQLNCRYSNRSIKLLLDDPKNLEMFARCRISARLEHFNTVATNVIQAIPSLPFLESLQRFTQHKGIQIDEEDRHDDAAAFTNCRLGVADGHSANDVSIACMTQLAERVLNLHVDVHVLGKSGFSDVRMRSSEGLATENGFPQGISRTDVASMLYTVTQRKEVLSPCFAQRKSRKEDGGFPRIPLTPLKCTGTTRTRTVRFQGFCTALEMVDLLGVPHIGDTGDFCYFTESIWAYHMLQQYLFGRKLTLVERAALLEEIDIY